MKRILIVDDAAFMRLSLKNMLESNGFTVIGEATNGAEGIQMYQDLLPDIVTMDITMPEMDGLAALKVIRSRYPDSKVIMVSAMGQESFVREAIVLGAKSFIVKPFKEEHVVKLLNQI